MRLESECLRIACTEAICKSKYHCAEVHASSGEFDESRVLKHLFCLTILIVHLKPDKRQVLRIKSLGE